MRKHSMRFHKAVALATVASMLVVISSCAFRAPTPPSGPPTSNGSHSNGVFPGPERVWSAIKEFCAGAPHLEYRSGLVLQAGHGYYLVELMEVESSVSGRLYLWVSENGETVKPAAGSSSRAVFEKYKEGRAWFLCTFVADCLDVFPYYRVVRVGEDQDIIEPWYRIPGGATYELSSAGLSYGLERVEKSEGCLRLGFRVKGPGPDGVAAGPFRPPKTVITESGRHVQFTFSDVMAGTPAVNRIKAFKCPYAKVEKVSTQSGRLEIGLTITGKYAVLLETSDDEDDEMRQASWRILFGPE